MDIREKLKDSFIYFDGSMGNLLYSKVKNTGIPPEYYNIENPNLIKNIHKEYLDSGSDVVLTNTFGANPIKFRGMKYALEEVIDRAYENARFFAKDKFVALDVGPTGKLIEPMGDATFDEIYESYKEVAVLSRKHKFDLVVIETMSDILEAKAAILAFKENTDLPIFSTMTFQEDGRTLSGSDTKAMISILQGLSVDALGVNCSLGPKELLPIVKEITEFSSIPVMVQPNAGIPYVENGLTKYNVLEEEFADTMLLMADAGVRILGGCCGTTPEYIKKMVEKIGDRKPREIERKSNIWVSSSTKIVDLNENIVIIGERINPAGKPLLREALKNRDLDYIVKEAILQKNAGADVLDVNVSIKGGNDLELLEAIVKEFNGIIDLPLQFDNTNPVALERALRLYSGVAIINSVNGKQESMDKIFPVAEKYGAMVIALTMDERGIPKTADERFEIAQKIVEEGKKYGIGESRFLVDCLTLSAASDMEAANETFKAIKMVKEKLGVKTTLGASNSSFGLPSRDVLNGIYLTMGFCAGLDAPITDPLSEEIQKSIYGYRFLTNKEKNTQGFLEKYGNAEILKPQFKNDNRTLREMIIQGLREDGSHETERLLKDYSPDYIVENYLIPALDYVGSKYEAKEIFLPHLLRSAEAVKESFEVIKKAYLSGASAVKDRGKVILATVEGDVHDIGKNIVKILLENYGFSVIDLGKDVKPEKVIESIKENNVKVVGLSALMTTTVPSMEKTIQKIRDSYNDVTVIVGGAVLNKPYAMEIGADYYAADARETVKISQKILQNFNDIL